MQSKAAASRNLCGVSKPASNQKKKIKQKEKARCDGPRWTKDD
jgi:hypothetical protein